MHPIEKLYREIYTQKVILMSRILRGDYHLGEDVVQEAFLRAWKFYDLYDEERASIKTWFNGILFNALRDTQRESRGVKFVSHEDVSPEDLVLPENKSLSDIERIISKVPNEDHRDVLYLFYVRGYTSKEISQVVPKMTQTNVTTIATRFKELYI